MRVDTVNIPPAIPIPPVWFWIGGVESKREQEELLQCRLQAAVQAAVQAQLQQAQTARAWLPASGFSWPGRAKLERLSA